MDGQKMYDDDEGKYVLGEPDIDPLERARHVWSNGRLEFMGGPVYSTQGNGIPGYENNKVHCNYAYPMGVRTDPVAHDLGVNETQQ